MSTADIQWLVWLSDSPTIATGFGRVTRQVLDLLSKPVEGETTCLGWGYRGTAEAAASLPYTVIPQGDLGSGSDNLPRVLSSRPVVNPGVRVTNGSWKVELTAPLA